MSVNIHEIARLARLKKLAVLDTANEPLFDAITKLASQVCGTPIALISLIDEDRQWFKANVGLDNVSETPREYAFCGHTIEQDDILEVRDASLDPRFRFNPLVLGNPNIRFYAGVPLALPEGYNMGSLCVIDRSPGLLTEGQRIALKGLAEIVSQALVTRENAIASIQDHASKLASIIENSEDAIYTKTLDGIITSWNPSAEKLFQYSAQEALGKPIGIIFPDDRISEETELIQRIKNNESITHFETVRKNKHGQRMDVSISLSPLRDHQGVLIGVSGIVRDISIEATLKNALRVQHERLKVTMDSIGDAVITTNALGQIDYLNPIAQKMTGWTLEEALGQPLNQVFNIINEKTRLPCPDPVQLCLTENRIFGLAEDTVLINKHGIEFGISDSAAPIRGKQNEVLGVVLVFHDVTQQRQMANEISFRASHDLLTGLLNRSEFEKVLSNHLGNHRVPFQMGALLFIDLDQFKLINDNCGHAAGDTVLREIAQLFLSCVRSSDSVARIGGDEFAIILAKCDIEKAMNLAKMICRQVDQYRFFYAQQKYRIGASIGLVLIDDQWSNINDIMQAADSACYEAKRSGKNRVHPYYDQLSAVDSNRNQIQWAGRLEQALEEQRFFLYFQYIRASNVQAFKHIEILLRLMDQNGQIIEPNVFLPAAERFNLIGRIDRWVITEVMTLISNNHERLKNIETIAINLSGHSISDLSFHQFALQLMDAAPSCAKRLCIEITETVAITNISYAKKFIQSMKQYGVRFSLDDFGSGMSSFGYLNNLPVDYLKIDGQFIEDVIENKIGQSIVRCICDVAKVTHAKTIAECVSSPQTAAFLTEMGVHFLQGHMIHQPEPFKFEHSFLYNEQVSS